MSKKTIEVLKKEYPTIYNAYKEIMDEQFELFAKKHLDYGMGNVSAGTQLVNEEEKEFEFDSLDRERVRAKMEGVARVGLENQNF